MENNISRGVAETASLASSIVQSDRFKERDARKADSVVRPEAVYFSPVIRIDPDTHTAIIQYRNSTTGAVTNEYPTPQKMESYKQPEVAKEQPQVAAAPPAKAEVKEVKAKVEKKPEPPVEHIDSKV